ncbi:putative toxin antitoxin plasmid stabilization system ParE [Magnetospirillum sp. XM-1]|uniref:type II toxin-antitoxin system RelE/ParE family toxin n=1 Tax=Magnetospirillum sp. XM-1 TaxID=1663591 RepID=UPI00073DF01E|nr:type II toxin-antitoxin system RelE/ParE family toxin [Magnetospirillum sp. XM-1]CUW37434.1 putative toxin antitoxin plasmid stabilization system ParE [Magnetospirillum sp. XM-1]
MDDYVLSNKADDDLGRIYVYSAQTFGEARADSYFLGLRDCLQAQADNPGLGRPAELAAAGLLRHEHGRHIVFYLTEPGGIFVARILHQGMDAVRHLHPDDGLF